MMQGEQQYTVQLNTKHGLLVVEGMRENIFHCVYTKRKTPSMDSPLEIGISASVCLEVKETGQAYRISSNKLELEIDKESNGFLWRESNTGRVLLEEGQKELTEIPYVLHRIEGDKPDIRRVTTVDGERNFISNLKPVQHHMAYKGKIKFKFQNDEHIYGLGQGEEGIYDYRHNIQYLYQHNMRIPIPFLISSKGYAILINSGSLMTFNDDKRGSYIYLDTVEQIDYYFISGDTVDQLVKGYRTLTGKATMLPKWAFGYIQSKETYHNQHELLDVAEEYRIRKIPIDCIVQDWHTWEEGKWGNKHLDKARYPDVATMNRLLHNMHIHSMISIWPNMNSNTEDYDEMNKEGYLLQDYATYNAFSEQARELYWKQVRGLFDDGFDSWWCDSTEPFSGPDWNGEYIREPWERYQLVGQEHKKFLNPDRANMYALEHAKGIYENQRRTTSEKRVFNLTRSGYSNSQKYGVVLWSGDISATWDVFKRQIVEGLNMGLSGMPYWTLDVGGFFTVKDNWQHRGCFCSNDPIPKWFWNGDYETGVEDYGYRELYVRWLQYAVFLPIFRSHGTDTPREVWQFGEPGGIFYEAIVSAIHLRYRLIPYIYSLAGKVWMDDYTIMRSLLFDFPTDEKAVTISSEFMFGESLLICPVTRPMFYDKNSKVLDGQYIWECYLPAGCDWYDFYTGEFFKGGQNIHVEAPLSHIPVFVKEGSIIPMENALQYAQEKVDTPLELYIYPGKDAVFELYDDAGDGYGFETDEYQKVQITWKDNNRELCIGTREGKHSEGIVGRTCIGILNGIKKECVYNDEAVTLGWL